MKLKEHLALRNVYLKHTETDDFYTCKCKATTPYLCWRAFWAVYHCSWLFGDVITTSLQDDVSAAKWFIYLSNWMYLILTLECVMEAILVVGAIYRTPAHTQSDKLPWHVRLMWLLYIVSVTGAVMVCLWYWTFIHKGREITAVRLNTHAVAALYILLNLMVTRLPLRLFHLVYPVAFGVTYTLFSLVYFTLGGTNRNGDNYIYSILDWSKAGRTFAISSLSNFVLIPVVHVAMWSLALSFQKLYDRVIQRHVVYNQDLCNVEDGEGLNEMNHK